MDRLRKNGRTAGLILLVLSVGAWGGRAWLVPRLITGLIRTHHQGHVSLDGWWLDGNSAGLVGLTLHETGDPNSPVWAKFPKVSTDLSPGGMVRGRLAPRKVILWSPELDFRFDKDARLQSRIPWAGGGKGGASRAPLPLVYVRDGRVTLRQEGHPVMVVTGFDARLFSDPSGSPRLTATALSSEWGRWDGEGEFTPGFTTGEIRLVGRDIHVTPGKEVRLPFVPADVWKNVVASGPVDLRLTARIAAGAKEPVHLRTSITLRRTAVQLPALGLAATDATGEVVIEDKIVKLNRLAGRALGGGVETAGAMDFTGPEPRLDLTLKLDRANVAEAPEAWKLGRLGVQGGRMTGAAGLRATVRPGGLDLSGSWGDGVVQGATMQGVPVKSLRLVMSADGQDVRYETAKDGSQPHDDEDAAYRAARAVSGPPGGSRSARKVQLLRSFSTEIDIEDVQLSKLVDKAAALGIVVPVEVAGRFSLKATATIPIAALRDIKGYVFRGRLSLSGASIAGVDVGFATAHVDLKDGVLDVSELSGRLVDLPDGGRDKTPAPQSPVAPFAPLPAGAFRGRLRAELAPRGRLTGRLEAAQLPLGELAAPALPRPTPLSGLVSFDLTGDAVVAALSDPTAWTASGTVRSERATFRGTTLDAVSGKFSLVEGILAVPELTARLGEKPLSGRMKLGLAPPYSYEGKLDVTDWSLDDLLAFVPGVSRPAPAGGNMTLLAVAKGTLEPWSVTTEGRGRIAEFRAGPVPLGDIPFGWTTDADAVEISGIEARMLGGVLTAKGRVPIRPGGSATGSVALLGLDSSRLVAALPDQHLKLEGKADIRVSITAPTRATAAGPTVAAEVTVASPNLAVEGIPTRGLRASVALRDSRLIYTAVADSLDGKVKFQGEVPLNSLAPAPARLEAGWFSLASLLRARGVTGRLANLGGRGAVVARLDLPADRTRQRGVGVAEFRGLTWDQTPLGNVRGVASTTPTDWRLSPVTGDLLGGTVKGDFWGVMDSPDLLGFRLNVDHFDLKRLAALLPGHAHDGDLSGHASVSVEGQPDKVKGEVHVEQATVFGLPVADLRLPAELTASPGSEDVSVQIRESSARLAGGLVHCDARLRLGDSAYFRADVRFSNLELRSVKGVGKNDRRPPSGKLSGRISLESPEPGKIQSLRGKAHLDLSDASLFELPVFRQINRFLGSEQGGIFEAGDVDLSVAAGKLKVDKLALAGRLLQLRAKGVIGLDGQIDLEVIVKPNRVIPQGGRAVVATMLGRGGQLKGEDDVLQTTSPVKNGPVKLRITGPLLDPKVTADSTAQVDGSSTDP